MNEWVAKLDSSSSTVFDEWNLHGLLLDTEDPFQRRVVLMVKLARKWETVLINEGLVIFLVAFSSILSFFIDVTESGDRMAYTLTLLLTVVLFDSNSADKAYLTLMDRYTLCTYGFLTMVMLENGLTARWYFTMTLDVERLMWWLVFGVFSIYHLYFVVTAWRVRRAENLKLYMTYDEVDQYVQLEQGARPVFEATDRAKSWRDGQGPFVAHQAVGMRDKVMRSDRGYDRMRDKVMRWHIEHGTAPFSRYKEDDCTIEADMYFKMQIKNSMF